MEKTTFVFNCEWFEAIADFEPAVRFEIYEAIMRYATTGQLSELSPVAKAVFFFIRKEMDFNRERYEQTVSKRKAAAQKRWAKKSAAAATDTTSTPPQSQITSQSPSVPSTAVNQERKEFKETKELKEIKPVEPTMAAIGVREMVPEGEALVDEFFAEERLAGVEQLCIARGLGTMGNFRRLASEVVNEWMCTGTRHSDRNDAYRHLVSQCAVKAKIEADRAARERRAAQQLGLGVQSEEVYEDWL